jgi:EgtB-related family protein
VWEWTTSAFAPYPGFSPHPYRDYSAPWFDGRPVLRGASFATQPRMRHPRYRNYFEAGRNDVFAGFRSCAARPSR